MSIFNFEADPVVHDGGIEVKGIADAVGQSLRITRFEQNNVAANLTGERLGRSQRHQVAFVQYGEAVAAFRFFHQVRGDGNGDTPLITGDLEGLPEGAPGAGIEAGGGAGWK